MNNLATTEMRDRINQVNKILSDIENQYGYIEMEKRFPIAGYKLRAYYNTSRFYMRDIEQIKNEPSYVIEIEQGDSFRSLTIADFGVVALVLPRLNEFIDWQIRHNLERTRISNLSVKEFDGSFRYLVVTEESKGEHKGFTPGVWRAIDTSPPAEIYTMPRRTANSTWMIVWATCFFASLLLSGTQIISLLKSARAYFGF